MLPLSEAVRRLAAPAPPGIDPRAYAILQAVWRTYPRAAAAWQEVIHPDQLTPARWQAWQAGAALLDETMVDWQAPPLSQQQGRLLRICRSPVFIGLAVLDDLQRLLTASSRAPGHWARLFFLTEAEETGPELLLGCYILQPFLYAVARRVQARLQRENRGLNRCPVCGGRPYHGYLHPQSRQKVLVCGKCQGPWIFPRLQCPFCGDTKPESHGFLYSEDAEHRRIDYCTSCDRIIPISRFPDSGCPCPLLDHLNAMTLLETIERRPTDA